LILYEGELVPRDKVAAGQWILLAAGRGHSEARQLLKEMELFLSADDLAEARKRAHAFKPTPHKAATGKDK
jgi:TPR repeat protein